MKQTAYQRIKKIMNFYYSRGQNREIVNDVYRKIIKQCNYCGQLKGRHKMSCATQKIVINLNKNE